MNLPIFDHQPVTYAFSTISDGNIDPRFGDSAQTQANLQAFCQRHQLSSDQIIALEQIHSSSVKTVDCTLKGQTIKGVDGLITLDPNVILMLKLADCVPVFIYDPDHHAIALVHSGWRGTISKIAQSTLIQLSNHFGTRPKDLLVALGPSLLPQSYKSPTPPVQSDLPEWQPFIVQKDQDYLIDLPGFIKHTLVESGVNPDNIFSSTIDTAESPDYFSHTHLKDQPEGRFAAVFKLNPKD